MNGSERKRKKMIAVVQVVLKFQNFSPLPKITNRSYLVYEFAPSQYKFHEIKRPYFDIGYSIPLKEASTSSTKVKEDHSQITTSYT